MFKKIFIFFTTNIIAKILALFFALAIWVYVTTGEAKVDRFPGNIPIEPRNVPVGMAIADELGNVEVKIKAPYASWQKLSADDFTAYVDLGGLDIGTYRIDVEIHISDPSISIIEKDPAKVTVSLEPLTSKEVPVAVKIEGKAAEGFATGETSTEPPKVEVRGAKSLVDNILDASAIVKLNGEDVDLEKKVRLTAFDASSKEIKNISFMPDSISVKIAITRATNTKTVGIKASIVGDPKENFWVSKVIITPSVAVVSGEPEELKELEYLETARIDIANISKTLDKEVDLVLPEGIALISRKRKFKVLVSVAPNLSVKEIPATLNFIGKPGSTSSTVEVKVSGPISILNNLYSGHVVIDIDLSNRGSGVYNIDKSAIKVPSGIDVVDFSPKIINIIIE
jgi:YbbR domain-containing protein